MMIVQFLIGTAWGLLMFGNVAFFGDKTPVMIVINAVLAGGAIFTLLKTNSSLLIGGGTALVVFVIPYLVKKTTERPVCNSNVIPLYHSLSHYRPESVNRPRRLRTTVRRTRRHDRAATPGTRVAAGPRARPAPSRRCRRRPRSGRTPSRPRGSPTARR